MTQSTNKTMIYKDDSGEYWFLGIYSNNYEDKAEDTISWDAHQEYAKWFKQNNMSVPITVMHLPRFAEVMHVVQLMMLNYGRMSREEYNQNYKEMYQPYAIAEAKAVIPINGFVFVIGKILKNKIKKVELLYKANVTWGMSHGFIPLEMDEGVIKKYRSFEFSILPTEWAANELTAISVKRVK